VGERITEALEMARNYGQTDGAHHKLWANDSDHMFTARTGPAVLHAPDGAEHHVFVRILADLYDCLPRDPATGAVLSPPDGEPLDPSPSRRWIAIVEGDPPPSGKFTLRLRDGAEGRVIHGPSPYAGRLYGFGPWPFGRREGVAQG
jgi:hypothetical protein